VAGVDEGDRLAELQISSFKTAVRHAEVPRG